MPTLLRRNLTCFYCGQRSSQKYSRSLREWRCEKCEAFNYLDENGQITDPPAPSTPIQVQYAQTAFRHTSPELDPPSEPLFCATCLKNQHLYTQSLGEYLPPVTDPQYARYEASYEEYKRNLERRYPQVCAQCEPRARARIQAAGYAAKTDHLRRMMERTRRGSIPRRSSGAGWRWMLVMLGGLAWWPSVLVQGAWHAAGAMLAQDSKEDDFLRGEAPNWHGCVRGSGWNWEAERRCFREASRLVGWSLVAAVLSLWWNPKLKDKISAPNVRMTGLSEHLWLQVVVIAVRMAAWWILQDTASSLLPQRAFGGANAFMLAFLVVSTIASLRTVQIDNKPRVLFSDDIGPLIAESEGQDSTSAFTSNKPNPNFQSQSASYIRPFPVSNLAPIPPSAFGDPPTPPPDDLFSDTSSVTSVANTSTTTYDPDSMMDWAPTTIQPSALQPRQTVLSPRAPLAQQQRLAPYVGSTGRGETGMSSVFGGPSSRDSPFYGTLPPRPQAPAAKLRNPYQPVFQRASDAKKENFFAKMMGKSSSAARGDGNPLLNADPYADSDAKTSRGFMDLAQPKWQLGEEQPDTGLEAMFDSVFSIKDEPAEIRAKSDARAESNGAIARQIWPKSIIWGIPLAVGVCFAAVKLMGWSNVAALASLRNQDLAAPAPRVGAGAEGEDAITF